MNNRTQYFIQILEKIGSPLMNAVIETSKADNSEQAQAKKIAELLSKSVQTSIALGELIDIGVMGEQSDSMRVALAGLSAPLIANIHRQTGQTPQEQDIKTITGAMQAVLSFSENFTPSPENTARLEALVAKGQSVDIHQIQAQYMRAFVPVINAVAEFPFGHQETKLMTMISSRLIARAEDIAAVLSENGDELEQKRIALAILNALAPIYAACHREETAKLTALNEDKRAALPKDSGGGISLDGLWKNFEIRAVLMETLVHSILGGTPVSSGSSQSPAVSQPAPVAESPAPPPAAPPAPPVEKPASPPPQSVEKPQNPPPAGNPMAMFAKKPSTPDSGAQEAPKPLENKDSPQPPVDKPVEPSPESGEKAGGEQKKSDKINPMAFFKTPPQTDEG